MCPRYIVDFGTVSIVCVFVYVITCFVLLLVTYFFLAYLFLLFVTSTLSFPLRIGRPVSRPDVIRRD